MQERMTINRETYIPQQRFWQELVLAGLRAGKPPSDVVSNADYVLEQHVKKWGRSRSYCYTITEEEK